MTERSTPARRALTAVTTAALVATGLSAVLATPGASAAPASTGHRPASPAPARHGKADLAAAAAKLGPLARETGGRRTVFVQFTGDGASAVSTRTARATAGSASTKEAKAKSAALARRAQVATAARSVLATARAKDARAAELFHVSNAVPGVALTVDTGALPALAARSDVAKISAIVPKKPSNASAAQLTKVLATWQGTGLTGDGVRVGIIDTGIDYTHRDFGGDGDYASARAHADDKLFDWRATLPALAKAKIAGGWDFVGSDYNADPAAGDAYQPVPHPDPNPLDCDDHGTHVSGTVAGYGENADGSTFTGDYSALDGTALDAMKIGPGMAPAATLYGLKVFGCGGSTDVVIPALDLALDPNGDGDFSDKLDIVNLSLGSDYGPADDPENTVIDSLAANGVLPVIAMGNNGDLTDTGGTPGNAVRSLAVASSVDALQLRDGVKVNAPTGLVPNDIAAGQNSIAYPWATATPVTGDVVAIPGANADGCAQFSDAEKAAVAGKVVWLEWDDNDSTRRCGSVGRSANAKAAGAIGALFTSSLEVFGAGITGDADIPVFQLPKSGTDALRPAVQAGTLNVTFDGSLAATIADRSAAIVDTVSSFTSRGTHGSIGVVKPDVTAPGDTIGSAAEGTGDGILVISGTSMATPHTAGIAALVKAAHPTWTVEQIKAAIMNTAGHDLFDEPGQTGHTYGPARVGAGRVDAEAAVSTDVLAYDDDVDGAVSASFGVVEAPIAGGPITRTRTIRVQNTGAAQAVLNLSYDAVVTQPGVTYTVSPSTLTLEAGTTGTATVTMTVDPAALRHTIDPTMDTDQIAFGVPLKRQYVSDASGRVLVEQSGRPALRVPVYGAAEPTSAMTAASGHDGDGVLLDLSGSGFAEGPASTDYTSLVSAMQFGAASPQLPACADGAPVDACTVNETATSGDLRYVGAGSAPVGGSLAGGWLWFGVSVFGDGATFGNTTLPYVDFDTTGDGRADFETYVQNYPSTDVLFAFTVDLASGDIVDAEPVNFNFGDVDTNVFDTDVLMLPVLPAAIGVKDTDTTFPISYRVAVNSIYGSPADGGDVDSVGPVSFDVARPKVSTGDPLYVDAAGASIPVVVSGAKADALVFHLHNASGSRAQKVTLSKVATALTVTRPTTIRYGESVTIKTHLRHGGTGIVGAPVALYGRSKSSDPWKFVRTVTTTAGGAASTSTTPKTNRQYQWRFAGSAVYAPSTSATTTISVTRLVSARATRTTVTAGTTLAVYGTTTPSASGLSVHLKKKVGSSYVTIRSTTTTRLRLPNGTTVVGFVFPITPTAKGTYTYQVSVSAAGGLAAGYSSAVTVTVT